MIKITNGVNIFEVTNGAYESIYRHQGYQVISADNSHAFVPESEPQKTADEIFLEELQEKPISQWNKDEVKRYAAINEIDLTGTKNVNEAKEVIKAVMAAESGE